MWSEINRRFALEGRASVMTVSFRLERLLYKESDLSISYGLSLNGRLFLAPADHLDALVCDEEYLSVC